MSPEARRQVIVESGSNPTVRMLRDLHTRSGRREHGAFLIEGTRLVGEAIEASWPLLAALYDAERAREDPELASLVERIPAATAASPSAVKLSCDTVTPQGIVAAALMPSTSAVPDPAEPMVLVMDGIADPGNAGTLLRSALAAGVATVLASQGSVDLFAPKVVRSGMGAHFRLKTGVDLPWDELEGLLGAGRTLVVAEGQAGTPYHQFDWNRPAALVVGGEARGPRPAALRRSAASVSIPLSNSVESLNAAVAGSVILFEAKRQREQR